MVITMRPFTARLTGLLLFLPSVLLGQSQATVSSTVTNDHSAEQTANVDHVDRPVPAESNPRYRITRDDVISLSFPLSPEFNQAKVMVQPDGYVALQGAG